MENCEYCETIEAKYMVYDAYGETRACSECARYVASVQHVDKVAELSTGKVIIDNDMSKIK